LAEFPPRPSTLTGLVIAALEPLFPGRVFDGLVPDDVPTDAYGYVLPYVALYSGVGGDLPMERNLSGLADIDVTDWRAQTSVVGPSMSHARDAAYDVQQALTNLPIGRGWLKPDLDSFTVGEPLPDPSVTPTRFLLPLRWRLTTT